MLQDILDLFNSDSLVKGVSLAVFGGFVRVATQFKGRRIKIYEIFCGVLAASFIGVMLMHLAKYIKMEDALANVLSIILGFLHTETITVLKEVHPLIAKKLKKRMELEGREE